MPLDGEGGARRGRRAGGQAGCAPKTAADMADAEKASPRGGSADEKKARSRDWKRRRRPRAAGNPEKRWRKSVPLIWTPSRILHRYPPPISLLDESKGVDLSRAASEEHSTADLLVNTLKEFGVNTRVIDVSAARRSPGMSSSPAPGSRSAGSPALRMTSPCGWPPPACASRRPSPTRRRWALRCPTASRARSVCGS